MHVLQGEQYFAPLLSTCYDLIGTSRIVEIIGASLVEPTITGSEAARFHAPHCSRETFRTPCLIANRLY